MHNRMQDINSDRESLIDLHIHSNYSDGDRTPRQILSLAKNIQAKTISITDHDTIYGIKSLTNKTVDIIDGITVISGVELSAKVNHGRMHILGYGIDLNSEVLINALDYLHERSISVVLTILEQIKKDYGIVFTNSEIQELINTPRNINRVDVAIS